MKILWVFFSSNSQVILTKNGFFNFQLICPEWRVHQPSGELLVQAWCCGSSVLWFLSWLHWITRTSLVWFSSVVFLGRSSICLSLKVTGMLFVLRILQFLRHKEVKCCLPSSVPEAGVSAAMFRYLLALRSSEVSVGFRFNEVLIPTHISRWTPTITNAFSTEITTAKRTEGKTQRSSKTSPRSTFKVQLTWRTESSKLLHFLQYTLWEMFFVFFKLRPVLQEPVRTRRTLQEAMVQLTLCAALPQPPQLQVIRELEQQESGFLGTTNQTFLWRWEDGADHYSNNVHDSIFT